MLACVRLLVWLHQNYGRPRYNHKTHWLTNNKLWQQIKKREILHHHDQNDCKYSIKWVTTGIHYCRSLRPVKSLKWFQDLDLDLQSLLTCHRSQSFIIIVRFVKWHFIKAWVRIIDKNHPRWRNVSHWTQASVMLADFKVFVSQAAN